MAGLPANSTICAAPFAALSVGAKGIVSPCCNFVGQVGSLKKNTLREIWENSEMRDLRTALAAGEQVKSCWKCWQIEDSNGQSLRQKLNSRFADRLPQAPASAAIIPDDPVYLDIRFSNLCNFKCRTCHHGASSRWFSDAKALGQEAGKKALLSSFKSAEDAQQQFEDIGGNVTDLYFAGGEPLLEKQHFELLRYLIAQKRTDVRLSYNTNLSTLDFGDSDIINLWREFSNLHIEVSIDAIGTAGAYIRTGFDWDVFRGNLKRLRKECPQVNLGIGVTVSVFNLLKLTELHTALIEACGVDTEAFNFHEVQVPRYYDIAILPKDIKERAMVQIEAYAEELNTQTPGSRVAVQLHHIAEIMRPKRADYTAEKITTFRESFREMTKNLDNLRSESILSHFPELSTLY